MILEFDENMLSLNEIKQILNCNSIRKKNLVNFIKKDSMWNDIKKRIFFKTNLLLTSSSSWDNKSWTNSGFPFSTAICNAVLFKFLFKEISLNFSIVNCMNKLNFFEIVF